MHRTPATLVSDGERSPPTDAAFDRVRHDTRTSKGIGEVKGRFRWAAWGSVLLLAVWGTHGLNAAEVGAEVGDRAPSFALPDTEGNVVAIEDYRGRPVAVVFYRGFF